MLGSGNDGFINLRENGHFMLRTFNQERLRILNTGGVGIATEAPITSLHVGLNNGGDGLITSDPLGDVSAYTYAANDGLVLANASGTMYSKLGLTGNTTDVLRGDGTFGPGGGADDDWTIDGNIMYSNMASSSTVRIADTPLPTVWNYFKNPKLHLVTRDGEDNVEGRLTDAGIWLHNRSSNDGNFTQIAGFNRAGEPSAGVAFINVNATGEFNNAQDPRSGEIRFLTANPSPTGQPAGAWGSKMTIANNGFVGIGAYDGSSNPSTSPNCRLDVYGDLCVSGNVNIASDRRFKTNIASMSGALAKILQLRGVTYDFTPGEF